MAEDSLFLDDLIEDFYEPIGPHFRQAYERGQIFWTHIGYAQEDLQLWRPTGFDQSQTTVNSFRIEHSGQNAFARDIPFYIPPLETNEEFIVTKAKRRPVILLSPVPPNPGIQGLRGGGRIHRRLCVVVPVYSLIDRHTETLKYPQEFIDRMRMMEYPQFLFLKPTPGVISSPSYVRVGEFQAVYQPHLEPRDLRLCDTVRRILDGQVSYLVSEFYGGDFATYREQLLHQKDQPK